MCVVTLQLLGNPGFSESTPFHKSQEHYTHSEHLVKTFPAYVNIIVPFLCFVYPCKLCMHNIYNVNSYV
jgi:hypothetical protein